MPEPGALGCRLACERSQCTGEPCITTGLLLAGIDEQSLNQKHQLMRNNLTLQPRQLGIGTQNLANKLRVKPVVPDVTRIR